MNMITADFSFEIDDELEDNWFKIQEHALKWKHLNVDEEDNIDTKIPIIIKSKLNPDMEKLIKNINVHFSSKKFDL